MAMFDAHVMVDWSAASSPKTGADSIWIAGLQREPLNPATRAQAFALLADRLSDLSAQGKTVLLGFDFALGYPQGFAARLDDRRPDWQAVWRRLGAWIEDGPDNANNRFEVAARLNRLAGGGAAPFWNTPKEMDGLSRTKPADFAGLNEYRLCETRAPGTQSVWKLYTAGSVGGQSLMGVAGLQALRSRPDLAGRIKVWPFETGLCGLDRPEPGTIIVAEVWPSLIPVPPGPVKDAEQVKALSAHFACLDGAGRLGPLFAGDPALSVEEKRAAEREEGWILGVAGQGGTPAADYIRDPQAIYDRSFAIIRAEADLARFVEAEKDVAVRVIHACGMPEIAADLAFAPGAAQAGRTALLAGKPVLTDVEMVSHGIIRRFLKGGEVRCLLNDPRCAALAKELGTTRSAAAVTLWRDHLDGAVVAIGNAPTALYQLMEMIKDGAPRPAAILGFPVGFVGAAESKEALAASGLPFIALRGRRGGSAMAAAAVNALSGGAK
ncbi:MAG TPA: precorrin-8X methylmutase [Candidatus Sulfotelmatobacter sp.]|jgi:precorrin-8X/cobalt-precorrin-8 methylmutase|nr:precorrin-8X methylmutase [Candidatus Sulfotelmatobacter sp.]